MLWPSRTLKGCSKVKILRRAHAFCGSEVCASKFLLLRQCCHNFVVPREIPTLTRLPSRGLSTRTPITPSGAYPGHSALVQDVSEHIELRRPDSGFVLPFETLLGSMAFVCLVSPASTASRADRVESCSFLDQDGTRIERQVVAAADKHGLSRLLVQPGAALAADRWVPVSEVKLGKASYIACLSGSVRVAFSPL